MCKNEILDLWDLPESDRTAYRKKLKHDINMTFKFERLEPVAR